MRRAVLAAFVLGGFACLLQLTLPLYALHVFESAVPNSSLETLGLLVLIAGGTVVTWVCAAAARDRILLRAGLWLDHTVGRRLLEEGERHAVPPAELEMDMDALAAFTGALAERTLVPALDAPWLALSVLALALLHPMMGAVAALFAGLVVVVALAQARSLGRLARQADQARKGAATWWLAATLSPSLPAGAAGEWEQLDRAHVAGAYALGKRSALLQDASGLLRATAQVALVAVGAWLVIAHELTSAALFACVLVNAVLLAHLQRLIGSLALVRAAMAGHRRLAGRAAGEGDAPRAAVAATPAGRTVPRLNFTGPLAVGLAAILLFIAAASGAAVTRLGDLAVLAGGAIFETALTPVSSPKAGMAARVHVREGADVRAGDLIVTLDTTALDRQIAALKAQAETAKRQLALVRHDVTAPASSLAADRPVLASLEQRTGELQQEAQWLLARIAAAEEELARSEIRAPVSRRVVWLGVPGPHALIAPGATLLDIATGDRSLLDRLLAPLLRGLGHRPPRQPS